MTPTIWPTLADPGIRTEHLYLDADGVLSIDGWLDDETYLLCRLGPLDEADWPADLGAEPGWFAAEMGAVREELGDWFDPREEAVAVYRFMVGG